MSIPIVTDNNRIIDTVDEIIPNMYLSGIWCLKFDFPEFNTITHILSITDDEPLPIEYTKKLLHVELEDNPLITISFNEKIFDFIDDGINNGKILIHCHEGKSRSPTYVIAYLMKRRNMSFTDAYKLVESKRDCIDINSGFWKSLRLIDTI